ncbi:2-hydroxychromene-2-carboxylate isomerase [Streptomyces profundus]|uniref:2-hydroxychromene-2-carboxylate isomerase n=1 Tax=Streptomyces profundus TaxID=2867410 RepID=UPI001D16E266|nr:DsbA family protein [Streptomyces sp. MA3_2.13]UED85083.1 DsbA family protein [Streptomyces sp. MA3_2.13]
MSAATKPGKGPRWYFSFRSPYSWMAYRELTENHPEIADTIEWIPSWNPDELTEKTLADRGIRLPFVAMSREKDFYILQDTARLTKARGWQMRWPVDRDPHWEVAHLAYLLAVDAGQGRAFADKVYQARWERGENISDRELIGRIGGEVGLDPERVATAADDPALRERGVAGLARGHKDGVFGVPFFVAGRDKFFGVDRFRAYVAVLGGAELSDPSDQSWLGAIADRADLEVPQQDAGHAGGCG